MTQSTALATTANNNLPESAAPSPLEWQTMKEQSQMLIKTGFLPASIKTPEQAIAIMLQGRELGIPTMAALGTINVIQGKPTVSPQLMLALINRSGQVENIEITNEANGARCLMKRKGRAAHTEFFGDKEAQAMQLTGKDNYKKQAATMFRWRAVAACARVVFPDVILGLYTPDEMGANVNGDGEIIPEQPRLSGKLELIKEKQNDIKQPAPPENSLNKQIGELCTTLKKHGDSIDWSSKKLTDYANELLDDEVKSYLDLSDEKKEILLGDLQGRLDELNERAAIAAESDGDAINAEPVDAAEFEEKVF